MSEPSDDGNDLAGLKAGDEVAMISGYGGLTLLKVTRITPKGRIVAGSMTFNLDGYERGTGYKRCSIARPTPEHRRLLRAQKMAETLTYAAKTCGGWSTAKMDAVTEAIHREHP